MLKLCSQNTVALQVHSVGRPYWVYFIMRIKVVVFHTFWYDTFTPEKKFRTFHWETRMRVF
jgi:hypothetical protein